LRFVEELIPRVARAGATGPKLLRADSGFWNTKLMDRLHAAGWTYSIGVRQQKGRCGSDRGDPRSRLDGPARLPRSR
jgi:hypothetical protein